MNSLCNSGEIENDNPKLKLVVLGDEEVGKSSLLISYTNPTRVNFQPAKKTKMLFADYSTPVTVDDKTFNVTLWDMNASDEYRHIRPLNFANTDLFLLCFSVASLSSLESVTTKWNAEIKNKFDPGKEPLKLLVGLKSDLRESEMEGEQQKKWRHKEQEQRPCI